MYCPVAAGLRANAQTASGTNATHTPAATRTVRRMTLAVGGNNCAMTCVVSLSIAAAGSSVRRPPAAFGRVGGSLGVALARWIVALAVALVQQGTEIVGEASRGLAASVGTQTKCAVAAVHEIGARDQLSERGRELMLGEGQKAHHPCDRRVLCESLALEPVQQLEQFVSQHDL